MAANGISTLSTPTGLTATSHTASFLVAAGTFTYDAYGKGIVVRKDGGPTDAYMAQVLALPAPPARQYTRLAFTYGQALINFTLNPNGTFSNVTVADGAGGYHATGAQLTMLGTQLLGGVSPANDIVWNYVCAGGDGVITSFTYASGTPPTGRLWTFVPANGQPSFTRAMNPPDGTQFSTEAADTYAAIWNVTTNSDSFLKGTGVNELDISLIPMGTEFNIYATELGAVGLADKEARQIAKLNIAQAKRQGKIVALDGTISGDIDSTKPYYRANNTYSLTLLPDTYTTGADDNANTSGLLQGRPWYDPNTEAFYDGEVLEVSPGIWRTNYQGYHNEVPNFFDTAVLKAAPDNFDAADNDINEPSLPNSTSMMLKGYLRVTYTGNYTIYLSCDDGAYLWFGDNAITNWRSGNTLTNVTISNGGLHGESEVSTTVALTAGTYIPLRVMFGNGPDGPGVLTVSYEYPGQAKTSDFTGKIFYRTSTNGF